MPTRLLEFLVWFNSEALSGVAQTQLSSPLPLLICTGLYHWRDKEWTQTQTGDLCPSASDELSKTEIWPCHLGSFFFGLFHCNWQVLLKNLHYLTWWILISCTSFFFFKAQKHCNLGFYQQLHELTQSTRHILTDLVTPTVLQTVLVNSRAVGFNDQSPPDPKPQDTNNP